MMGVDRIVVVGASLGGVDAVQAVFQGVRPSTHGTIAIVQHRAADSGEVLIRNLQRHLEMPTVEAEDKALLVAGQVAFAPAGYHLLVDTDGYSLSTESKVHGARPSIDVLFESAARSFGGRATAVVLTSASCDGAAGAALIEASGGSVLVQDPESAMSPILPNAAVAACRNARTMALDQMADFLISEGAL